MGCHEYLHGFEDQVKDLKGREKFNDEDIRRRGGKVEVEIVEESIEFWHSYSIFFNNYLSGRTD